MKTIEETNEILDKLGYAQHGYTLPKTIEELNEFHSFVLKHTIDKDILKAILKDFYNPKYADECNETLENFYIVLEELIED
jgi:hypothetical protein